MSLNVALVAIGRMENIYAREFVEHYKNLGFSKIIIMDNNHDGEEYFEEALQDYIDQGFVIVEDYRNQIKPQMRGYTEMYSKYKNDFDWIAFFDFDEFLFFADDGLTLDEWLDRFPKECESILVNWMNMTDNDLVLYDSRPLVERFTKRMDRNRPIQYNFPENMHVKSIIRGRLDKEVRFGANPHATDTPLKAYSSSRFKCDNRPWQPIDWSVAYLKHFTTKTIEEWMTRKMKVGTPDREPSAFLPFYKDRFFKINQMTEDKMNYLKSIEAF